MVAEFLNDEADLLGHGDIGLSMAKVNSAPGDQIRDALEVNLCQIGS